MPNVSENHTSATTPAVPFYHNTYSSVSVRPTKNTYILIFLFYWLQKGVRWFSLPVLSSKGDEGKSPYGTKGTLLKPVNTTTPTAPLQSSPGLHELLFAPNQPLGQIRFKWDYYSIGWYWGIPCIFWNQYLYLIFVKANHLKFIF